MVGLKNYAPSQCACGEPFSIAHALSCLKGGYPSIRNNEIRDLTADLLSSVSIEPHLQPIGGEVLTGSSAILEDSANGFWGGAV